MTTRTDLIQNIESALGSALSTTTSTNSAVADLFEAYVFSLIIEAARTEGARITYHDVNGSIVSSITFRTSPGYISSRTRPYTYALIDFPGKPLLEAHLGVYIAGKSGMPHECDVAIVYRAEAETCRRNPSVLPRHSKVFISVECKFYASNLGIALGRGFMGLYDEISIQYGARYFVTNTTSFSVERLLSAHRKQWEHEIVPSSTRNVNRLINSFQTEFKNFKARN